MTNASCHLAHEYENRTMDVFFGDRHKLMLYSLFRIWKSNYACVPRWPSPI